MTFTISFGWWLLPLAVTIIAFSICWWVEGYDRRRGYYSRSPMEGIVSLVVWSPGIIVSLIAWLIWALLT